jgi:hypothetical protein
MLCHCALLRPAGWLKEGLVLIFEVYSFLSRLLHLPLLSLFLQPSPLLSKLGEYKGRPYPKPPLAFGVGLLSCIQPFRCTQPTVKRIIDHTGPGHLSTMTRAKDTLQQGLTMQNNICPSRPSIERDITADMDISCMLYQHSQDEMQVFHMTMVGHIKECQLGKKTTNASDVSAIHTWYRRSSTKWCFTAATP